MLRELLLALGFQWTIREIEMKKAISFAVSLALCSTGALADSSVLVPGKPAGVHQAQDTNTTVIVATLALAGLGIALAVSANNAGGPTTSTAGTSTSTTTTTGTTS